MVSNPVRKPKVKPKKLQFPVSQRTDVIERTIRLNLTRYNIEIERNNPTKNGKGKLILEEDKFYEGNWVNEQPHGKGLYHINGEVLPGIFRFGKIIIAENEN